MTTTLWHHEHGTHKWLVYDRDGALLATLTNPDTLWRDILALGDTGRVDKVAL